MPRLAALVLAVCALACGRPHKEPENGCLELSPARRDSLTVAPDGQSLYWLERTRNYDFDADLHATWQLVQHDLRTRRTERILDNVTAPIRFIGGQLLAVQKSASWRIVLRGSDGHTQELTPTYLDVLDVEILDAHTIVFLADGDGARAVYVLDVANQRPYHLVDADVLLSASAGRVFARLGDEVLVVDVKTRTTTKVPFIKRSQPQAERLIYVEDENVMVHDMVTHASRPLITTRRSWKVVYIGDTTLVRTAPKANHSYAYLIVGDTVQPLPTVLGGASILDATNVGKQTWALIGHNTANFIGDLADTAAEVDVCRLPSAGVVTYPTRQVPARFTDKAEQLFRAIEAASPGATLGISDDHDQPVTLFLELKKEFGARDVDSMRKRVRTLHGDITRIFHDREVRTEVMFADRRTASVRWKRDRLRARTQVGMGDAMILDPEDFDFEVSNLVNEKHEGKITCSGTLRNLTHRALSGVDVKCSGNRKHLIHFDKLDDNEARPFSQTFDVSEDDEAAYVEVLVDSKLHEAFDADYQTRAMAIFTLATDAYAATGLSLLSHDVGDEKITVALRGAPELLARDAAQQETAVTSAYAKYLELRRIYGVDEKRLISVHVSFELSETTFNYDGDRFGREN